MASAQESDDFEGLTRVVLALRVPTSSDFAIFRKWTTGYDSLASIAGQQSLDLEQARGIILDTEKWARKSYFEDPFSTRVRQLAALEDVSSRVSSRLFETNDVRYSAEFRRLLQDSRKILGIDRPAKSGQVDKRAGDLPRVAGLSQKDALIAMMARIQQLIEQH